MLLAIIIVGFGLLCGWMTRRWKRRSGVVWAIVGVAIVTFVGQLFERSISGRYSDGELADPQTRLQISIVAYGAPMVAMALFLLSLPKGREPEPELPPWELGRRRHGRIAIANCDAGASAYTDAAIDEASRAVGELLEDG